MFRKTTADPTVNDDLDKGYNEGDFWVNETSNKCFVCVDNADGAALWDPVSSDILTESGGQDLTMGAIADLSLVQRSGTALVGSALVADMVVRDGSVPFTGDVTRTGANGQVTGVKQLTEDHTLAAAVDSDTTIVIPANCIVLAVTARVTTEITGPTNWKMGKATDNPANRYGATLALAAGTTQIGLDGTNVPYNTTAVAIRFSAQDDATAFTAGVIRVTLHYIDFVAETS